MDLFADLTYRGLVYQCTHPEQLGPWLAAGSRTVYAGFDPTSDSLHVGSLLPVMTLRRFQQAGHRPIALVGGATGMIGDPSGKSEERNLLSVEQLEKNVAGIEGQLRRLLDFEGKSAALLLNNFNWMKDFSYLGFLRDVGKHFPVATMLAKDSVKGRLASDAGISYTEFSYMLLQAYDFVYLKQHHGCELQVGGSDQWGNITAGIDLARRMHGVQLYGMTCPLLLKSDGSKMGKTERGAIYLDARRTSPYAFYQYWINVADADCGSCLRFLTELRREEIEALDGSRQTQPHLRESQKRLAEELTGLIHGKEGLAAAKKATEIFFGAEIEKLSDAQLTDIFADVPSKKLPKDWLSGDGMEMFKVFKSANLVGTRSEFRRLVAQGGCYINNRRRDNSEDKLTRSDLASETTLVLRSGKKRYALVMFV
jgi:tyrosyl-tRNA synthetase